MFHRGEANVRATIPCYADHMKYKPDLRTGVTTHSHFEYRNLNHC